MGKNSYVIRGGLQGRDRLRLLSRVLRPATVSFLEQANIGSGSSCLDVGCGGGDVTFEIARLAGPRGKVLGLDIDQVKIDLARNEAAELGLSNLRFQLADIAELNITSEFDFVYSRFLLTHLSSPELALQAMLKSLRPGGRLLIEDIDFRGHFCHPQNEAFNSYVSLYTEVVRRNGADANIGARLPQLLRNAGCEDVTFNLFQPAGLDGELKLIAAITMENIGDAVLHHGLATAQEIDGIVEGLYHIGRDGQTLMSGPRIVQCTGRSPEHSH